MTMEIRKERKPMIIHQVLNIRLDATGGTDIINAVIFRRMFKFQRKLTNFATRNSGRSEKLRQSEVRRISDARAACTGPAGQTAI